MNLNEEEKDVGEVEVVGWLTHDSDAPKAGSWLSANEYKKSDGCAFEPLGRISDFERARAADRAEIERLRNKLNEFNVSFEKYDHEWQVSYGLLIKERDQLRAEYLEAVDVAEAQTKTIDRLHAELESLKAQEPVAWKYQWVRPSLGISTAVTLDKGEALANCDHGQVIPLYASPVVTEGE